MAASWWLARLLLAYGQRQLSGPRARSTTPPSTTASSVFRQSAAAKAASAAMRLRAVCGTSVPKRPTVPVTSPEIVSVSKFQLRERDTTGSVPFSDLGPSSSRKRDGCSEAETESAGDARTAGAPSSLEDKSSRRDEGKEETSTGWEGRQRRKIIEQGGTSEEEDFVKGGRTALAVQEEHDGDVGGEAAWIAAEIFDDLQRHSILYVVSSSAFLPVEWSPPIGLASHAWGPSGADILPVNVQGGW